MHDLLTWYIAVEALGLVALPLVALALPHLPDRGWSLAKPLAILLIGLVCWLPLMLFPSLPYSRGWILLVVLVFAAANAMAVVLRPEIGKGWFRFVRRQWLYVLCSEAMFAGALWVMGSLRALNPQPENTEKFMDLAFLSSIMRAAHLPPPDPWLAGYPINYYYFGHFLLATLAKLLDTAPQIAFNTGIALTAGLVACGIFGVAANLAALVLGTRRKHHTASTPVVASAANAPSSDEPSFVERAQTRLGHALPFALFSVVAMLVMGNLRSFFNWWGAMANIAATTHRSTLSVGWDWLTHPATWAQFSGSSFDYWWPTRAIPHTITEFPDFSFLLADLHAHLLALPYTVLAIGIALHFWLSPPKRGLAAFGEGGVSLIVAGLSIGALYLINGWDLPTYLFLELLAIIMHQWNAHGRAFSRELGLNLAKIGAVVLASCFIPYLPFYLTFISPSQGIGIVAGTSNHLAVPYNFANPDTVPQADSGTRTAIGDELGMNGVSLFIVGSWLVVLLVQRLQALFAGATSANAYEMPEDEEHFLTNKQGRVVEEASAASGSFSALPQTSRISADGTLTLRMDASIPATLSASESWARAWGLVGVGGLALVGVTMLAPLWEGWTFLWAVLLGAVALWLVVQPYLGQGKVSAETAAISFPLLLFALALGLIAVCEIVYLHDVFAGWGPRMNTVFKFYYQVWTLLALACAPAMAWLVTRLPARLPMRNATAWQPVAYLWRGLWGLVLVGLVAVTLIYPLGASHVLYPIGQQVTPTLDGLANNTALDPGDIAAIRWLQAHVSGSPVITEAIDPNDPNNPLGADYSPTYGRISSYTGLPTIIGWPGHEYQWRVNWFKNPANAADYNARLGDLATIYTNSNRATVLALLHTYHVQLVIVGPEEQQTYGAKADVHRFGQYLTVVYDTDGVVIYQVPSQGPHA